MVSLLVTGDSLIDGAGIYLFGERELDNEWEHAAFRLWSFPYYYDITSVLK
jgi:hypothetical protein